MWRGLIVLGVVLALAMPALAEEETEVDWKGEALGLRVRVVQMGTRIKQLEETIVARDSHIGVIHTREIGEVSGGLTEEFRKYQLEKNREEAKDETDDLGGDPSL
jgi:hypothetical protein